jgi:uncharacterized iron-regulated membrane protein
MYGAKDDPGNAVAFLNKGRPEHSATCLLPVQLPAAAVMCCLLSMWGGAASLLYVKKDKYPTECCLMCYMQ